METKKWTRKTALLIATLALVCIGIAAEPANASCSCEELTVSGAGYAEINGTYTYDPSIITEEVDPGIDAVWLGPTSTFCFPELTCNWALLRTKGGKHWIFALAIRWPEGSAFFFAPGADYQNRPDTKCPPESGWSSGTAPPPTLTRAGCLCAGIGDVNDDGYTDLLDVRLIYAHASGFPYLPAEMLDRADVDDDGDVDLDDARLLAEQVIGICP